MGCRRRRAPATTSTRSATTPDGRRRQPRRRRVGSWRAAIAGHGFGAMVAATAAALQPDAVAGVALIDGGWEDLAGASRLSPAESLAAMAEPPESCVRWTPSWPTVGPSTRRRGTPTRNVRRVRRSNRSTPAMSPRGASAGVARRRRRDARLPRRRRCSLRCRDRCSSSRPSPARPTTRTSVSVGWHARMRSRSARRGRDVARLADPRRPMRWCRSQPDAVSARRARGRAAGAAPGHRGARPRAVMAGVAAPRAATGAQSQR